MVRGMTAVDKNETKTAAVPLKMRGTAVFLFCFRYCASIKEERRGFVCKFKEMFYFCKSFKIR